MAVGEIKAVVLAQARALGFDLAGVAPVDLAPRYREDLAAFVGQGRHAGLGFLARRLTEPDPARARVPGAASVIVVASNYLPPEEPAPLAGEGEVARWAATADYHQRLGGKLRELARFITATWQAPARAWVDTGPFPEKAYAVAAGLGWQGRHTLLITPGFGSWVFLGVVVTALALPPDQAVTANGCGDCRRCLAACPTGALDETGFDARKCLAYLTIEAHGAIPAALRPALGRRLCGCDRCQEVCPHNRAAQPLPSDSAALCLRSRRLGLAQVLAMRTEAQFREQWGATPAARAGRLGLLRAAAVVAGNSGCRPLAPLLRELHADEADPVLHEQLDWALARLEGAAASTDN